MRPLLSYVEGVEPESLRLLRFHDLDVHIPSWGISLCDGVKEVPRGVVWVGSLQLRSLFPREVLYALGGDEVVLDPEVLSLLVVPHECVAAIAVHVSIRLGCPPIAEEYGDLVDRLGCQR